MISNKESNDDARLCTKLRALFIYLEHFDPIPYRKKINVLPLYPPPPPHSPNLSQFLVSKLHPNKTQLVCL